ncbi:hypothetical protein [Mesoterricola silvestris]|nr:hypothetical protein [Mesoterricola silvestris]
MALSPAGAQTPVRVPVRIVHEGKVAWFLRVNHQTPDLDLQVDRGDGRGFRPLTAGRFPLYAGTTCRFSCSQERSGRTSVPLTGRDRLNPYGAKMVFTCEQGVLTLSLSLDKAPPPGFAMPVVCNGRAVTIKRSDWAEPAAAAPEGPAAAARPATSRLRGARVFAIHNASSLPWLLTSPLEGPEGRNLGFWRASRMRAGVYVGLTPATPDPLTLRLPPGRRCYLPVERGSVRTLTLTDCRNNTRESLWRFRFEGPIHYSGEAEAMEVAGVHGTILRIKAGTWAAPPPLPEAGDPPSPRDTRREAGAAQPSPQPRKRKPAAVPEEPPGPRRRVDLPGAPPFPGRVLTLHNASDGPWILSVEGPDRWTTPGVFREEAGRYLPVEELLEVVLPGDCYDMPPGARRYLPLSGGAHWVKVRFMDRDRRNPPLGFVLFDASTGVLPGFRDETRPEVKERYQRVLSLGPDAVTLGDSPWDPALLAGGEEKR